MKMRVLNHETLLTLNTSSVQAGRSQNLRVEKVSAEPQERYWITADMSRDRDGHDEVRVCIVLSLRSGDTAWLDVSAEEFSAIPEIDVPLAVWETAMCAGTPPQAP